MLSIMAALSDTLGQPLRLKNGVFIKNRFMKSAMSESLADRGNGPTEDLDRLYGIWAGGGGGLLITGHVMVDRNHLAEPRNVCVEDETHLARLQSWARAGTREGTQLWVQLNHPGKQVPKALNSKPVAPSALPLREDLKTVFATPRALTEQEIEQLIGRFAEAADVVKRAGFTGVQIHGAHGYLVSQFLSPRHNQRDDRWGGSLQNRARFALELFRAIRSRVGPDFPVSIKLNSADFQKGGFSEEDSLAVAQMLASAGLDLLEISGGTFENPTMTGLNVEPSTAAREAFFLDYAEKVRKSVDVPLAVTGGFRSAVGMAAAVESGATDLVGLARPFCLDPAFPAAILRGEEYQSPVKPVRTGFKRVDEAGILEVGWYAVQLRLLGAGKPIKPTLSPWSALYHTVVGQGLQSIGKRVG